MVRSFRRNRGFATLPIRSTAALASLAVVALLLGLHVASAQGPAGGPAQRTVELTYSVALQDVPSTARSVSIWVPLPTNGPDQQVLGTRVKTSPAYSILRGDEYGNTMVKCTVEAPFPSSLNLSIETTVQRHAVDVFAAGDDERGIVGASHEDPMKEDLQPDALVPIDGRVADIADSVTAGVETDLEKARAIYDYVTHTMTYDKSGKGWGRGDAIYACTAKSGNCTDFHSLILGMARAVGIPARFVMGIPLPENERNGEIGGYHCWAQLYVRNIGWLPLDSSEASKHPEKEDAFFGGLDANRVRFTTGRDLKVGSNDANRVNFLIYPYVEVDGVAVDASSPTRVVRDISFREVEAPSTKSR